MLFQTALANQLSKDYTFASISTPGTTPRCWYYMLREADPQADRYAAILMSVADYDNSEWEIGADWAADIAYLAPILKFTETAEFVTSFNHWPDRWQAFRASLLKGTAYQRDFQDLLAHSPEREKALQWARENSAATFHQYVPPNHTVEGLQVDLDSRNIIRYPASMTEAERSDAHRVLLRDPPPQPMHREYLQKWFGKIVDHYRGSKTRLLFMRLPRGPLPRVYPAQRPGPLREYATQNTTITLLDEHLLDDLERPELFMDAMHVNARGSEQLTRKLTSETVAALHR
jgi:hypothetical protein